jgi:2-oxoglutarate dehydrogenase E1 component
MQADLFEQTLQQRYLGNKRFSLEGITSLLPLWTRYWMWRENAGPWNS